MPQLTSSRHGGGRTSLQNPSTGSSWTQRSDLNTSHTRSLSVWRCLVDVRDCSRPHLPSAFLYVCRTVWTLKGSLRAQPAASMVPTSLMSSSGPSSSSSQPSSSRPSSNSSRQRDTSPQRSVCLSSSNSWLSSVSLWISADRKKTLRLFCGSAGPVHHQRLRHLPDHYDHGAAGLSGGSSLTEAERSRPLWGRDPVFFVVLKCTSDDQESKLESASWWPWSESGHRVPM